MARTYKRDKNGRFSSTGGGAKAAYKNARSNARAEARTAQEFPTPANKKRAASAQGSLTKLTKSMHGGTAGNIGRTKKGDASSARQNLAGMAKKTRTAKASAPKKAASKKQPSTLKGETGAQMRDRLIREHKPRQNNPKKGTKAYEKDMKETVASRKALSKDLKKINDKYSARKRRAAAKG